MYSYNANYFKSIDNEEKAYWLGFLYADGCINEIIKRGKLKGYVLEISLAIIDYPHLEKFLKCIHGNSPIKIKHNKIGDKVYESCRISVCSTEMCRDLMKLGCIPRKSLTIEFPYNKMSSDLYKHFIRGYFDGDGCVSFYKNNRKTVDYGIYGYKIGLVGTKNMLDSIMDYFVMYAHMNRIKYDSKGKAYQFLYSGYGNLEKVYNAIYKNAQIFLQRKKDKFDSVFEERLAVYSSNAVNY
jgi:hypothetical protein